MTTKKAELPEVKIEDLFEAGVHFGHKTSRWNPKMAPYIYGEKDKTHIIDLRQTAGLMQIALKFIYSTVKRNGRILFVGTNTQSSNLVEECAKSCGQYYVNHRWLGGTLTNWNTISKSIKRLDDLEVILGDEDRAADYTKKEILEITRSRDRILKYLGGIRNMGGAPSAVVVMDIRKEKLAIREAKKLNIPVIGIIDTDCNPDDVDYIIPGNDNAARSIKYYCDMFAAVSLVGIEESLIESGVDLEQISNKIKKEDSKGFAKYDKTKKARHSYASKQSDGNKENGAEFDSLIEGKATPKDNNPQSED